MSYARFSDHSDVYVYSTDDGVEIDTARALYTFADLITAARWLAGNTAPHGLALTVETDVVPKMRNAGGASSPHLAPQNLERTTPNEGQIALSPARPLKVHTYRGPWEPMDPPPQWRVADNWHDWPVINLPDPAELEAITPRINEALARHDRNPPVLGPAHQPREYRIDPDADYRRFMAHGTTSMSSGPTPFTLEETDDMLNARTDFTETRGDYPEERKATDRPTGKPATFAAIDDAAPEFRTDTRRQPAHNNTTSDTGASDYREWTDATYDPSE